MTTILVEPFDRLSFLFFTNPIASGLKAEDEKMLFQTAASFLAVAGLVAATPCKPQDGWETKYTATASADVAKAAATAKTSSPTSHVKGKAFDRLAIIYFENQNYDKSFGDREWNSQTFK